MKYRGIHREVKTMYAVAKKLLTTLVAIVLVALAFTGFVMTGTAAAQPPSCLLYEDFSDSWLPNGWTTDNWDQSDTNYAGGTSPEARLPWFGTGLYAYLASRSVDTTGASSLTLEFRSSIDDYSGIGSYNCSVYTRANITDTWTDMTPWDSPIYGDVNATGYAVDISSDIGSATQVRFEFNGQSNDLNYWYVDDVKICAQPPVGGKAYPVNKASLLAPWITVGVLLAGGAGWYVLRRRRAQS